MAKSLRDLIASGEAVATPAGGSRQAAKVSLRQLVDSGEAVAQEAPPQPKVGPWETYATKAANAIPGGRPLVDMVGGAITHAFRPDPGATLTPQARAELEAMGEKVEEAPGLIDSYRTARDTRRTLEEAGAEQNKWAGRLGTATGIGLTIASPLFRSLRVGGGGLGSRLLSGMATGGLYGGINAATSGKADLTRGEFAQAGRDLLGVDELKSAAANVGEGNYGRAALDVASAGAPGGALLGGAAAGLVEGIRPLAGALRRFGASQGRKVLLNGADSLSSRQAVPDDVVAQAVESGGIRPFRTTQDAFERLDDLAAQSGDDYARIVADLEARGVQGPLAREVADELLTRGAAIERNTMIETIPAEYLARAEQVIGKAAPNPRMGLTQAEDIKRSLQTMARYGRVEETPLNATRRDIARVVTEANERAIDDAARAAGPGTEVAALNQRFVPIKRQTGRLIQAREAARRGAARASQRTSGSLPGKIETTAAIATGNPGVLLAGPLQSFVRNRVPSALASSSIRLSNALQTEAAAPAAARYAELVSAPLVPRGARGMAPAFASEEEEERTRALVRALRGE